MQNHKKSIVFYLLASFSIIIIALLMVKYSKLNIGLTEDNVSSLDTPWQYYQCCSEDYIELPANLVSVETGESYSITNTLPLELVEDASLLIRTSHQSIQVYIGNDLIYERGTDKSLFPGKALGNNWNLIELSKEHAGKIIKIVLNSPYEKYSGLIREITYGSKASNLLFIIENNKLTFIFDIIIFSMSMSLLIISVALKLRKYENDILLYFSEFSVLFSLWMLGESQILQFFTGNIILITYIYYIALWLLPLPFILFIKKSFKLHKSFEKKFLDYTYWAFVIDFILCLSLHSLNIYAFSESLWIHHTFCGVGMVGIITICIYEFIKFKNKDAWKVFQALTILFIFTAIEIFQYNVSPSTRHVATSYLRIGYCIFSFFIGILSIGKIRDLSDAKKERQYYKKLAYMDLMTLAKNRTAYIEEVNHIFQSNIQDKIGLVLFDLNDLKAINDNLGHLIGDEAIKKAYECIYSVFGPMGNCYRIGGDEFACIIRDADASSIEHLITELNTKINLTANKLDYNFNIATGYAICSDELKEKDYTALYIQADKNMYDAKEQSKK